MMRRGKKDIVVALLIVFLLLGVTVTDGVTWAKNENHWESHTVVVRTTERSISNGGMKYDGKSYTFGYRVPRDNGKWKRNATGWWYAWPDGTYPTHAVLLINGKYYYFNDDGYMAQNGYYYGVYYGKDGSMQFGTGCVNADFHTDKQGRIWFGSYVPDKNGNPQLVWWKRNGWLQIHGEWYFFVNGYAVTRQSRMINGKRYEFSVYGRCINP